MEELVEKPKNESGAQPQAPDTNPAPTAQRPRLFSERELEVLGQMLAGVRKGRGICF